MFSKVLLLLATLGAAALIGVAANSMTVTAADPEQIAKNPCMTCHGQGDLSLTLPSGEKVSLLVDPAKYAASPHGNLDCSGCHQNIKGYPHPAISPLQNLREFQVRQTSACNTCHSDTATVFHASIHGDAENADLPLCVDCHNVHESEAQLTRSESVDRCTTCHTNADLMNKYGISTNVVSTYLQDFHGKSFALLAKQSADPAIEEAVCTDCHGTHNIQPADSADSAVIRDNLTVTCGKCHPGATANFTSAWLSHAEPGLDKAPAVFIAQWFYWFMIPFVVVGMLIHIALDIVHIRKRKGASHGS